MKKIYLIVYFSLLILLCGCQLSPNIRFQRISFDSNTLREELSCHVSENTQVTNSVDDSFPNNLPMYKITE